MTEPHVLVVTSAGATPSAVVPVLAALEAAGMRVRAIDVGGAGGGGSGVADRVRRVLLGEGAERRLRRELDTNPPDVAIAFDPHVAIALTVARDQSAQPSPVVGIVGELEPAPAWGQTDCDRLCAVDAEAAVTLADHGVDGDRVLIVGPLGPRIFADAGADDRAKVRARFGLSGSVVVVEVGGLGGEVTGQLGLQLSLSPSADTTTFLFDAAGDADAAAVLRRQVPTLGLRAKLFGATPDAPLLWRAGDVVVARAVPESIARAMLVGARMVALTDDAAPATGRSAAALETRKRGAAARSALLISSAIEAATKLSIPAPSPDGADNVADIVWTIAGERRAVVEERRAAARAATTEKVRTATQAAAAAARATAMPGDLEDLGGGATRAAASPGSTDDDAAVPDAAELAGLRAEVKARLDQLERSVVAARRAADEATSAARAARERNDSTSAADAADAERRADAERARMHTLLGEMAGIEAELRDLDRAASDVRAARPRAAAAAAAAAAASSSASSSTASSSGATSSAPRRPAAPSVDDLLADLKRKGGTTGPTPGPSSGTTARPSGAGTAAPGAGRRARPADHNDDVDDELAALKRKMTEGKKP